MNVKYIYIYVIIARNLMLPLLKCEVAFPFVVVVVLLLFSADRCVSRRPHLCVFCRCGSLAGYGGPAVCPAHALIRTVFASGAQSAEDEGRVRGWRRTEGRPNEESGVRVPPLSRAQPTTAGCCRWSAALTQFMTNTVTMTFT